MTIAPKRGTILSCFFPMNESPDKPGPQARPALSLGSFTDSRNNGQIMVIVAYGTSRLSRGRLSTDIHVDREDQMKASGLHRPTRFTMNRLRILPFTKDYFATSKEGQSALGMLCPDVMAKLNRFLDDLADHAEELNFFRPKEARARGRTIDPLKVDQFMKQELTGTQKIRRRKKSINPYRRRDVA